MQPKGKKLLKAAGILCVILGIIVVFTGFYIMMNAMAFGGTETVPTEEEYRAMKLLSLGGLYILVFGVIYGIAGFVGVMNADDTDFAKKCRIYGIGMLALCLVNFLVLAVWGNITALLSILIVAVPAGTAGLYTAGAYLNVKEGRRTAQE